MSQTLVNLNTRLAAHAATANANRFIMGYIEDVHELRDQNITDYPVILVLPPILPDSHDTELEEFDVEMDISIFKEFNRNKLAVGADYIVPRLVAWDAANVIGKAFILAMNGDAYFVLKGLFEIAPDVEHPKLKIKVKDLYEGVK